MTHNKSLDLLPLRGHRLRKHTDYSMQYEASYTCQRSRSMLRLHSADPVPGAMQSPWLSCTPSYKA